MNFYHCSVCAWYCYNYVTSWSPWAYMFFKTILKSNHVCPTQQVKDLCKTPSYRKALSPKTFNLQYKYQSAQLVCHQKYASASMQFNNTTSICRLIVCRKTFLSTWEAIPWPWSITGLSIKSSNHPVCKYNCIPLVAIMVLLEAIQQSQVNKTMRTWSFPLQI